MFSHSRLYYLNKTIRAAKGTELYRDKGLMELKSLDDLAKLPFISKQDLRDHLPYGGLAVLQKDIVEMHTTSGTTGNATLSFYTKKDLEVGSRAISEAWRNFGIGKNSKVMFIMSYGLYSGAVLNTYAIQTLGAFVIPAGIQPLEKQYNLMKEFGVDTVVATPGFLLYLYEWMKEHDMDRSELKLERAIAAGEIYSDEVRADIENKLKIKVFDHYGICEVNTGIAYECGERDGLHVIDDYIIPEVIDPDTLQLMPEGKYGELVLTSLKKEASPIIRYRTGDITCMKTEACKCGNKRIRIDRVKARIDHMLFIKGLKVNPYELADYIRKKVGDDLFGGDIQIVIKKNDIRVKPRILLSAKSDIMSEKLKKDIYAQTKLEFEIECVDRGYFNREKTNKVKFIEYV